MDYQNDTSPSRTLAEEREKASFDINKLTHVVYGTKALADAVARGQLRIQRDAVLNTKNYYDLSRPETRKRAMTQIRRVASIRVSLRNDQPEELLGFQTALNQYDRALAMRLYVHDTLFRESVFLQGTSEQWKRWQDDIVNLRILGCYAMTELGHSSFLRGIETTATYDRATQEFVIHSPTLTSTKWWIGMAGCTATHTVALCQLIIDKKSHGIHWFIVPMRNPNNGELLPGVAAGDVGAKAGRNGVDNGWIQFSYVRIPRENMLMKWATVSPDGAFSSSENPAVSYASLIGERLVAVIDLADLLAQSLTIAIRYGAIRRQGAKNQKILDYQSHYCSLVPILATTYGLDITYRVLMGRWQEAQQRMLKDQDEFLRVLPFFHSVACSLKAWFAWWGIDALELIRRSMGGHSYSAYNAVCANIADYWVMTTGGGDNVVLAQQHVRYLLSAFRKAVQGKKMPRELEHFEHTQSLLAQENSHFRASNESDLYQFQVIVETYKWLQVKLLATVGQQLNSAIESGSEPEEAWNQHLMKLLDCSRVSAYLTVLECFIAGAQHHEDPSVRKILEQLCTLFGLSSLEKELALLLQFSYFDTSQAALIKDAVIKLCQDLRQQAVPLTDAFAFPDFILKAPVGRYDGDIYRAYFETVRSAPAATEVVPFWAEQVAPLVATSKL